MRRFTMTTLVILMLVLLFPYHALASESIGIPLTEESPQIIEDNSPHQETSDEIHPLEPDIIEDNLIDNQVASILATPSRPTNLRVRYIADDMVSLYWDYPGDATGIYYKVFRNNVEYTSSTGPVAFIEDLDPCNPARLTVKAYNSETSSSSASPTYNAFASRILVPAPTDICNNTSEWATMQLTQGQSILYRASSGGGTLNIYEDIIEGSPVSTWVAKGSGTQDYETFVAPETKKYYMKKYSNNQIIDIRDGSSFTTYYEMKPVLGKNTNSMTAVAGQDIFILSGYKVQGFPYVAHVADATHVEVYDKGKNIIASSDSPYVVFETSVFGDVFIKATVGKSGQQDVRVHRYLPYNTLRDFDAWANTSEDYMIMAKGGETLYVTANGPADITLSDYEGNKLAESLFPVRTDTVYKNFMPSLTYTPATDGPLLIRTALDLTKTPAKTLVTTETLSGHAAGGKISSADGKFYVAPSYVADPIQTSTGAQTINKNLMIVRGARDIVLDINYNSLSNEYSSVGRRWEHSFKSSLTVGADGSLGVTIAGRGKNIYTTQDTTTYTSTSMTAQGSTIIKKPNGTYELQLKDASQYLFNSKGLLTQETDSRGKRLDYTYNNSNQLTRVREPISGNYIQFTYASSKLDAYVTKITDNNSRSVTLVVNPSNGNLTSFKDSNGNPTTYTHNAFGQIVTGTDEESNILFSNEFDSMGRVVKQTDSVGGVSIFKYTSNGDMLTTVSTDRNGNATTFVHNADIDIVSQTDALGHTTKYTYERNHQPSVVEHPDGTKTTYTHDAAGQILSRTEASGRVTSYVYDNKGNVIEEKVSLGQDVTTTKYTYATNNAGVVEIEDDMGVLSTITYDSTGRMVTKTDAAGKSITYLYDGWRLKEEKSILGATAKYKYDGQGRVSEKEDSLGGVTKYTYDSRDNILTQTNAEGATTSYTYNSHGDVVTATDPLGYMVTYQYNGNGKLIKVSDTSGTIKTITYDGEDRVLAETDAKGNITSYTYDPVGHILSVTDGSGARIAYTYDILGRVKTVTEPSGLVTTNTYDDRGRVVRKEDSAGRNITTEYDTRGNVILSTDALGNETSYTYDERDRLLSTSNADGTILTYEYNVLGNLVSETDQLGNITTHAYDDLGRRSSTTDALGNVTTFDYDTESRLVSTTLSNGAVTKYSYDIVGRLSVSTDPLGNQFKSIYDLNGRTTGTLDAMGVQISTTTYDPRGNATESTDALGNSTTYEYDTVGNIVRLTDPRGHITTNDYDIKSRHTSTTDAAGGVSTQTYHTSGEMASYTDPNGNTTTYTYDIAGRLATSTDATGYTQTYAYNKNGNVVSLTDSEGSVTTFEYNSMNRLVRQTDDIGETIITYDDAGRILTTTENGAGQISRMYDELGRPISYTDSRGNTIGYAYDSVGNLVEIVYPGGNAVRYSYDLAGRMKTVTDWMGNTTLYEYDANGRLTQTQRPDGSTETREYDAAGQLTRLLDTGPNGVLSDVDYTYDTAGNVVTEGGKTYQYDNLSRLINGNNNYTYDATGNLTSVTSSVYNNDIQYSTDNRISTYIGIALNTDARGNLLSIPQASGQVFDAVYDVRNRLLSYMGLTYQYDAEGNRVGISKAPFSVSEPIDNIDDDVLSVTDSVYTNTDGLHSSAYFVNNPYGETPQVLLEQDGAGNTKYYVYGIGLIAEITDHGEIHYYHYDRRGSTIALTDSAGTVTQSFEYSDYGELISGDVTATRFLYNGKYGVQTDSNGLYYMQSRYYSPEIKRFVNRDIVAGTIGDTQSLNRFAYTNGNPILYIDPFGFSRDSDSNPLAWPYLFVSGMLDSAKDTVIAAYEITKYNNPVNMLLDPTGYIQRQQAIANALLHPGDTALAVWDSVATPFKDNLINGSGNDRARYAGSAVFNLGTAFMGVGPAKVGSLAGKATSGFKATWGSEAGKITFGTLPVEVTVRYTPVMSKPHYRKKMMALEDLSNQGVLVKTSDYVRDTDLTYAYRKDLAGRMWRQYASVNKPFAEKMREQIFARTMHPDHVWELQLGGPDVATNLRMLHAGTNTSVGSQIGNQMRNYPDGTPIIIKWVE